MNKIGKWMIVCGIIVILIPIIGRLYVNYKAEQMYRAYEETLPKIENQDESVTEEKRIQASPNSEAPKEKSDVEEWKCPENVAQGDVLGKLTIKKINLDLLLVEGVGDSQLGIGAGHMPDTALPGQCGNCVIAGHRNYTFGSMFNRLDEVQVGDMIEVELAGKIFNYQVTKKDIIVPNDLSVTNQDENRSEITLITCHPIYSSKFRLIIKGKLIS